MPEVCFICVGNPYTDNLPDIITHCGCVFHEQCLNKRIMEGYDSCARCLEKNITAGLMCNNDGMNIQLYPSLTNDRLIVLSAVRENGKAITFASGSTLRDDEISHAAVKTFPGAINFIDDEIITKELILLALENCSETVPFRIPSAFMDDIDIATKMVQIDGLKLENLSVACCSDYDVNMEAVRQNGLALNFVDGEWKGDRMITDAAISQNGLALKYASRAQRNNPQVVMKAMNKNVEAFEFASDSLKSHARIIRLKNQLEST